MRQEEAFDGAVEDDHFYVFVGFECGDDLIQLRNGLRAKDIERRMINRYSPIVGRAPRKMYLLRTCCHLSFGFHVLSPHESFQPFFKAVTASAKRAFACRTFISPPVRSAEQRLL